jgi:hypothetical protein
MGNVEAVNLSVSADHSATILTGKIEAKRPRAISVARALMEKVVSASAFASGMKIA